VVGVAKFSSSVSATSYNATTQNIFAVDGTERMRITSAGNVGIGTSSPTQALHLSSASAVYCRIYNTTGGGDVYLGSEAGIGVLSVSNAMALDFRTNNTTRIYTTSAGNVGIGTSSPSQKLEVVDTLDTFIKVRNTTGGGYAAGFRLKAGADNEYGFFGSDNACGIRDFTNSATRFSISSSGVVTISNLGSGAVTATSGVLSTTSDMTLKVEDGYIDNALEKISQLKPRYFYWKEESGLPTDIRQLGFYAQEVNQALGEEAANTPKNENDKWGIYDRGIIAMLTKGIQELKAEIETLKQK
jgi:hypothetical protein